MGKACVCLVIRLGAPVTMGVDTTVTFVFWGGADKNARFFVEVGKTATVEATGEATAVDCEFATLNRLGELLATGLNNVNILSCFCNNCVCAYPRGNA